jgi:hypothetical protein
MMEETLQIFERPSAQFRMRRVASRDLPIRSAAAKSFKIQSGWRESSGDLKIEPRARRDPLNVPCTYHKGARHTLCGCRLRKKIDQERSAPRSTQTPTSPDVGDFQKIRVRVSPND